MAWTPWSFNVLDANQYIENMLGILIQDQCCLSACFAPVSEETLKNIDTHFQCSDPGTISKPYIFNGLFANQYIETIFWNIILTK